MKIHNANRAVIAPEKLRDYLLDPDHRRGGPKARLLLAFGYRTGAWRVLETDIRAWHLTSDVSAIKDNPWGRRFEIRAPLMTPSGRSIIMESIWQIDSGNDVPRFITMYSR